MANRFAIALCVLTCWHSSGNAEIVTGDVQIIGYRSFWSDQVAFVSWVDFSAGASLYFTNSGFFDDGTMRDNETRLTWTATEDVAAGTVVVIESQGSSSTADIGTASGRLNLNFRGDQVFVGTTQFPNSRNSRKPGSAYSGQLLTGLDFNGQDTGWDPDAVSASTSALPSILGTDDLFNLAVSDRFLGQYEGAREGLTVDEFRSQIDDPSNWSRPNGSFSIGSGDFTISAVPEPAGGFLVAFVGFLALAWRRKKTRTTS